jgi:hypothetical protein
MTAIREPCLIAIITLFSLIPKINQVPTPVVDT